MSVTTSLVRNAMQMMIMRKAYSAEHVMNRLDLNRVIVPMKMLFLDVIAIKIHS